MDLLIGLSPLDWVSLVFLAIAAGMIWFYGAQTWVRPQATLGVRRLFGIGPQSQEAHLEAAGPVDTNDPGPVLLHEESRYWGADQGGLALALLDPAGPYDVLGGFLPVDLATLYPEQTPPPNIATSDPAAIAPTLLLNPEAQLGNTAFARSDAAAPLVVVAMLFALLALALRLLNVG